MKNKFILLTGIFMFCCMGLVTAQSGFLKIGDIEGEATDSKHKDWIVIESVSYAMGQQKAAVGSARRVSAIDMGDLILSKKVDKSSPKLLEACANGRSLPELELEMVTSGRLYYKVTLRNARLNHVKAYTVCEPNCVLMETISIGYNQITWEYWDRNGQKEIATYNRRTGN